LPKLTWIKNSNNTHGYIRATVDFSVGPKPINATGYRARTLNDKRLISTIFFSFSIYDYFSIDVIFDFLLLIPRIQRKQWQIL
jgi:hypothetical protein